MLRNLPVTHDRLSYSQKVKSWLYFLLNSKKQKYTSRYIKIVQTLLDSVLALAELQTVETLIWKASQALARGVECAVCCVLCALLPWPVLTLTPLSFSIRAEPAEGETEAASDRAAYQPDRAA